MAFKDLDFIGELCKKADENGLLDAIPENRMLSYVLAFDAQMVVTSPEDIIAAMLKLLVLNPFFEAKNCLLTNESNKEKLMELIIKILKVFDFEVVVKDDEIKYQKENIKQSLIMVYNPLDLPFYTDFLMIFDYAGEVTYDFCRSFMTWLVYLIEFPIQYTDNSFELKHILPDKKSTEDTIE